MHDPDPLEGGQGGEQLAGDFGHDLGGEAAAANEQFRGARSVGVGADERAARGGRLAVRETPQVD